MDKLPDRALSFITHSTLSFPSFLLVPWLPSSRLSRGRSSRLRITLPPLLLLAAAPLLLEVSLIPRRINATRPGWITTTINFIERTISYGGYRARRERNLRDTWRDKGGGGGGGSYLASKTAREDIAWNLGENWVDRLVLEFWMFVRSRFYYRSCFFDTQVFVPRELNIFYLLFPRHVLESFRRDRALISRRALTIFLANVVTITFGWRRNICFNSNYYQSFFSFFFKLSFEWVIASWDGNSQMICQFFYTLQELWI